MLMLTLYFSTINFNRMLAFLPITGVIRGTSKAKLYQKLGLESLQLRRWFRKLCSFYKIYKNKQPSYLSNIVPKRNSFFNNRNVDKVSLFKIRHF